MRTNYEGLVTIDATFLPSPSIPPAISEPMQTEAATREMHHSNVLAFSRSPPQPPTTGCRSLPHLSAFLEALSHLDDSCNAQGISEAFTPPDYKYCTWRTHACWTSACLNVMTECASVGLKQDERVGNAEGGSCCP